MNRGLHRLVFCRRTGGFVAVAETARRRVRQGAGALTLVRPDDFRAHGIDERVPLKSYDDQLVYWDVLLKDLAGGGMK